MDSASDRWRRDQVILRMTGIKKFRRIISSSIILVCNRNMLTDNDSIRTTLISGDPELCKTFLFEAAISCAREGKRVLYYTAKQLQSLPPMFHDRSQPSADALEFITFVITPTYEELAAELLELLIYDKPPSWILIDDLDEFAAYPGIKGCSRELHVARCCLLIVNVAIACAKKFNNSERFHVWATTYNREKDYEKVYEMYFDNRWVMNVQSDDSDEGRRVWMRKIDDTKAIEYHRLDDPILVLRRYFEKSEDT